MKRYAADLICDTLKHLGVRTVFGMAGSQNLALFESLRTSGLRTIASTSELAASFAANGFYRASGNVGVLATIPGPGFIFSLSGITEARLDSAGILMITSSETGESTRKFLHQQIDINGIAGHLFKQIFNVDQIDDLVPALVQAYQSARLGEPGPVMVHLRRSIYGQYADFSPNLGPSVAKDDGLKYSYEVGRLLSEARHPLIYIGQGCASNPGGLRSLAERIKAPVMSTCSGRGILPENHPLSLVYDYGLGGGSEVNACIESCDLVLALGCKFSHNGSGGFRLRIDQEKLIHVDASEEVVGANYSPRIGIIADAGCFVERILEVLKPEIGASEWRQPDIQVWRERFKVERNRLLNMLPSIQGKLPISCESFFADLRKMLPVDACIVTDSGYHQMITRQLFSVENARGLITPADFQSMGFGVPAAIGAAIAAPHRKVVAIVGDGGMAITGMELLTAVREGIELVVIVFNDGYLGLIRRGQIESYGKEHAVALQNPDFALLANAIGANYFALDDSPSAVLEQCLNTPGINILEVCLKDSPNMLRTRFKRAAQNAFFKNVPPVLLDRLKQFLRRTLMELSK
jgi:acetolactate synthase I/II/III large subunit